MQQYLYLWDCFEIGIIDHNYWARDSNYNDGLQKMASDVTKCISILDKHVFDFYNLELSIKNGNTYPYSKELRIAINSFFDHIKITNNGADRIIPLPKFYPCNFTYNPNSVRVIDDLFIPNAVLITVSLGIY